MSTNTEEAQLISRCQGGDADALEELITRYKELILRFAHSMCSNTEDANDIVSRVIFVIYTRLQTFRGEGGFSSWLFRIVRNTYIDFCRTNKHYHLSLDTPLLKDGSSLQHEIKDPSISPEDVALKQEALDALHQAISYLPPYQREAMVHYAEGKSHEEISSLIGVPIGTIKSRLNRARANLRIYLEDYYS